MPTAPWFAEDTFARLGAGNKATHYGESGEAQNLDHCVRMWQLKPGTLEAVNAQVVLNMPDLETGLLASDHCGLCVDLKVPKLARQASGALAD